MFDRKYMSWVDMVCVVWQRCDTTSVFDSKEFSGEDMVDEVLRFILGLRPGSFFMYYGGQAQHQGDYWFPTRWEKYGYSEVDEEDEEDANDNPDRP